MSIYLDNAATTRVCPEAAEAAMEAMTLSYANPNSPHAMGRAAKALMERGRVRVAKALGCDKGELYFTSCGTEGDNWALRRGAEYNARHGRHILSSEAEHPAVIRTLDELEKRQGFTVTRLKPAPDGSVTPDAVLDALREDTCLVSLMTVNNETGAVTDIAAIVREVKARNPHTLIHTDAVQAFLKVPLNARSLGADLITLSGHKIHAPKGVGALYVRRGLNLPPLLTGGGQEEGKRSGTQAVELIAAFGAAAEAGARSFREDAARMAALREHAVERLTAEVPGLLTIGGGAPQILSISLPGWRSEVLMNYLESKGISVAKSSACKKGGRSQVLTALKLPAPVIDGAIRVSLSRETTAAEIDAFCDALAEARRTIRGSVR